MSQSTILHIEDDPDDAFFLARALRKACARCAINRVKDGREAIAYLEKTREAGAGDNDAIPELVLLDLKLPDVNGFEVLEWIRSQPRFQKLVVAILSGSSLEEDRKRADRLAANAYFIKSPDYAEVVAYVLALFPTTVPAPPDDNRTLGQMSVTDERQPIGISRFARPPTRHTHFQRHVLRGL